MLPRWFLADGSWTITDAGGMIDVAMVDSETESKLTLLGGITDVALFSRPLTDAYGAPIDGAKPFHFFGLIEIVSDAAFDNSLKVVIGLADSATLSGIYAGGGINWDDVESEHTPYIEHNAANKMGLNSSGVVSASVCIPKISADKVSAYMVNTLDSSGDAVNATDYTTQPALVATHLYVAFRRDGTAGSISPGVKIGSRITPNVSGGFHVD